jgi:sortase (surface protein transpeptidase)
VLGLAGVAIVAPVVVVGIARPSQGAQLDARSQLQRVLPVPEAKASVLKQPAKERPVRRWKQMPPPVRLLIPAIGVSAPMIPLGLNRDETAQTPNNTAEAGWFVPGPEPGEKGAAVIIGHVDSRSGPGVFYRLRALRPRDLITVVVRDHRRLQFVVTRSRQVLKVRFPTALVFARTTRPTLRLVTCGGRFNRSTGHYLDNYIVFARLVGHH